MQYGPTYVGLRHDRANRRLIDAFHREQVLVWVYTPNSIADIRRALALGVDGVISDFPERISQVDADVLT
jgi:glycerophosphoryl diester phosphodiesterase